MKLCSWNVQLLHAAGALKMLTDETDKCRGRYTGCSRNKIRIIKKKNHTILYMCDQNIF